MPRLRVREIAEAKGISQRKLAKTAQIAYATLDAIYTNPYSSTNITTLNKIAAALGVRVKDLFDDELDTTE